MSAALFAAAAPVLAAARALQQDPAPALLVIDGRCGSGKSTLAAWLGQELDCQVVHMDDFYLPFARRRPDWMNHPGANMDFARLRKEVLDPLLSGHTARYRAYVCPRDTFKDAVLLPPRPLTILEGSYSLHPDLAAQAACRVFVTCSPACQRERLQSREGDHFAAFEARWIPLEEGYLAACHPETSCDFVLDTTAMSV